jgi:hypothetical protein
MNRWSKLARTVAPLLLVLFATACASTYPTREISEKQSALNRSATAVDESKLLSVRIETFDPGKLPEDPEQAKGLSTEIRSAEAYYFPTQLRHTMERSGHWGPVRVVPKGTRDGEVIVAGRIIESDGEALKLEIAVRDASGVDWFKKEYSGVVNEAIQNKAQQQNVDAFQFVYNEIANDIAAYNMKISATDATQIRRVAALRFGADMAPATYGKYLTDKAGAKPKTEPDALQQLVSFLDTGADKPERQPRYQIKGLPPKGDPLVQRVERIRGREEFLIDTLDQQYDGLARNISGPYQQWRRARLKEINAVREAERLKQKKQGEALAIGILGALAGAAVSSNSNCYGCQTAGAVIAGTAIAIAAQKAVQASEQAEAETRLRTTAMKELGESLANDVKPVVVEVEGKTVELKGTVEQKFQQWKNILDELRAREIGLPPEAPAEKKTGASTGATP